MDLSNWVKIKEKEKFMVKFLVDLPRVMVEDNKTFGPVKRGSLMLNTDIPTGVLPILLENNVVKRV